jgi:hypothetical protein
MNPIAKAVVTFMVGVPVILFLNQVLFYGACFEGYCLGAAMPKTILLSFVVAGVVWFLAQANEGKPLVESTAPGRRPVAKQAPELGLASEELRVEEAEVGYHRTWRGANRQQSRGGWIYVFPAITRNTKELVFKVGMTAGDPANRMAEYSEQYSLVPQEERPRKYRVPADMVTAFVEEHVHNTLLLKGYVKPRDTLATELYKFHGNYPQVVADVVKAIEASQTV